MCNQTQEPCVVCGVIYSHALYEECPWCEMDKEMATCPLCHFEYPRFAYTSCPWCATYTQDDWDVGADYLDSWCPKCFMALYGGDCPVCENRYDDPEDEWFDYSDEYEDAPPADSRDGTEEETDEEESDDYMYL